jgi:hypothetical protein
MNNTSSTDHVPLKIAETKVNKVNKDVELGNLSQQQQPAQQRQPEMNNTSSTDHVSLEIAETKVNKVNKDVELGNLSQQQQPAQQRQPGPRRSIVAKLKHGLRQLSDPTKQERKKTAKDVDTEYIKLVKAETKNIISNNELRGFSFGIGDGTTTKRFIIPHHLMIIICEMIGQSVPVRYHEFDDKIPGTTFGLAKDQWERVTVRQDASIHRSLGDEPLGFLGKQVEDEDKNYLNMASLTFETKPVFLLVKNHSYLKNQLLFSSVKTTCRERISERATNSYYHLQTGMDTYHYAPSDLPRRKEYYLQEEKYYEDMVLTKRALSITSQPCLDFQLKFAVTSHYAANFQQKSLGLLKLASMDYQQSAQQHDRSLLLSKKRHAAQNIGNEIQNNMCCLLETEDNMKSIQHVLNNPQRNIWTLGSEKGAEFRKKVSRSRTTQETPKVWFVRDLQSLSSLSCVDTHFHQFMLNSKLWNRHSQQRMAEYSTVVEIAKNELEINILNLRDTNDVVAAARELSDSWTKRGNTVDYVSDCFWCGGSAPKCGMCMYFFTFVLLWLPIVAYTMAQSDWCLATKACAANNATDNTNATSMPTFPGILDARQGTNIPYKLLVASLVIVSSLTLSMFVLFVRVVGPRCRFRKLCRYCSTLGCRKTWTAFRLAQASRTKTQSDPAFVVCILAAALFGVFLGPCMLILRGVLWGGMTDEQRSHGTIEELLFPMWPFLVIPTLLLTCGPVGVWVYTFPNRSYKVICFQQWFKANMTIASYLLVWAPLIGLCFFVGGMMYVLKVDHADLLSEVSIETASAFLIVGVVLCCCLSCIADPVYSVVLPLVLLVPGGVVAIFVVQWSNGVIGFPLPALWVYPLIVMLLPCIPFTLFVCLIHFGGWGSS